MTDKGVMLDLETFGTKPGCVIRSIGAVVFDMDTGALGEEFYVNVEQQSCLKLSLEINPDTALWWSKQDIKAQESLLVDQKPVNEALAQFCNWFGGLKIPYIWCQGANFDAPIIEEVIFRIKRPVPWKFWNVRDTRTAYYAWGFDPKTFPRGGTYHNALDDAKYQSYCMIEAKKQFLAKSKAPVTSTGLDDLI